MKPTIAAKKLKPLFPISVGIQKENATKKMFSRNFSYERKIEGFGTPLVQKVQYVKSRNSTIRGGYFGIDIISPKDKSTHGYVHVGVYSKGLLRRKEAWIEGVQVYGDMQGKGLTSQMITEAVHNLKKMGVKDIYADVTTTHDSMYKMLGFKVIEIGPEHVRYHLEIK
jgi:hypothetical protein